MYLNLTESCATLGMNANTETERAYWQSREKAAVKKRKRRWNPTCYCVRDVAMILFPIINTEQTHEEHPHARRMARPF
ncbi:hypothetical protein ACMV5I_28940 [Serratia sp. T13T92]|uniref:hypothetical protein n=1 Tax=Serratia sp. T13T92 TaxID=3397496 RepID=UPI0039E13F3A